MHVESGCQEGNWKFEWARTRKANKEGKGV